MKNTLSIPRFLLLIVLFLSITFVRTLFPLPSTLVCVLRLSVTLWTVARQGPLSKGFSRQEYRSGLPCPPPEDLPDSGIKSTSFYIFCIGRQFLYH